MNRDNAVAAKSSGLPVSVNTDISDIAISMVSGGLLGLAGSIGAPALGTISLVNLFRASSLSYQKDWHDVAFCAKAFAFTGAAFCAAARTHSVGVYFLACLVMGAAGGILSSVRAAHGFKPAVARIG